MRAKKIVNQSSDFPVRRTGSYRHKKAVCFGEKTPKNHKFLNGKIYLVDTIPSLRYKFALNTLAIAHCLLFPLRRHVSATDQLQSSGRSGLGDSYRRPSFTDDVIDTEILEAETCTLTSIRQLQAPTAKNTTHCAYGWIKQSARFTKCLTIIYDHLTIMP